MSWVWVKILSGIIFVLIPGFTLKDNLKKHPFLTIISILVGLSLLLLSLQPLIKKSGTMQSSTEEKIDSTQVSLKSFEEFTGKSESKIEKLEEEAKRLRLEKSLAEEKEKSLKLKMLANEARHTLELEKQIRANGNLWFVIMGSYPHNERAKAVSRKDMLRRKELSSYIINTDDYPNFRSGLYSVVAGPYSKKEAMLKLASLKIYVGDAYINKGYK